MVYLVFVPSKAFRMIHRMSRSDAESETETLRPVYEFSFLAGTWSWAEILTQCCYTNSLRFPNVSEFLELQKYSKYPDYYRLFCFDRFCFLPVVCLFWWLYCFLWWVFAIQKLEYSRYNAKTKYELVWYNTYSSDLFSYTNGSHEVFVEFCVIEVFKFWVILRWMKE